MDRFDKKITVIFIILIIVGTFFLLLYHSQLDREGKLSQERLASEEIFKVSQDIYKFGEIEVDLGRKEIEFPGVITKNKGKVKFLIYLQGYKWLKTESAIVSKAKLSNLQNAIALIDWQLWDNLWYRKKVSDNKKIRIWIKWQNNKGVKKIDGVDMIKNEGFLNISKLIFLGSPYLDDIVLGGTYEDLSCLKCPLLPLEKEMILDKLEIIEYKLNETIMPPISTEVEVIITIR